MKSFQERSESRPGDIRKTVERLDKPLSWERFFSGGSLRRRPIQPVRGRAGRPRLRRQIADSFAEAEQTDRFLEFVETCQAGLRGESAAGLLEKALEPDELLPVRQAAILQLLELADFGQLRRLLARAAKTPPETDKNLSLALFNAYKGGAFGGERILKKAPDFAVIGFDIGPQARIAFRPATAGEMMASLGNVSPEGGVELDISSWRVALGLEPVGAEDDRPESAGGDETVIALRRAMIEKIGRIARDERLRLSLTRRQSLLFGHVLANRRLFLA